MNARESGRQFIKDAKIDLKAMILHMYIYVCVCVCEEDRFMNSAFESKR